MGTLVMAKMGRPSKLGTGTETDVVRVPKSVAQMVKWIMRIKQIESASLCGPILEEGIKIEYAKIYKDALEMKTLEDKIRATQGLPPTEPLPEPSPNVITDDDTDQEADIKAAKFKKPKKG